jgi:DNA mismatch endonuclease, patch repair protein
MDKLTPARRSENMRRIKSKNTKPEMVVRSTIHRMGFRYRLHRKDLPGNPDIVFPALRKVIFVHGCFWHGHQSLGCADGRVPKSRLDYWLPKLQRNRARDLAAEKELTQSDWQVLTIWDCETIDPAALRRALRTFLSK